MREGNLSHKYVKGRGQNRSYGQGRYQPRPNDRNRRQWYRQQIQDRIIEVADLEEISEEIAGRVVEKGTEMKGMVTTTIEIGTDQRKENPKMSIVYCVAPTYIYV